MLSSNRARKRGGEFRARWRSACTGPACTLGRASRPPEHMAEIRVEPKRHNRAKTVAVILTLLIAGGIAYYLLYYRNGGF